MRPGELAKLLSDLDYHEEFEIDNRTSIIRVYKDHFVYKFYNITYDKEGEEVKTLISTELVPT